VLLGLVVAAVLLAVYVTARGVVTSTRVSAVLEVLSLLAITAVLVATLAKFGFAVDIAAATSVAPFSPSKIAVGAVIAVTIFVGFESAGSLGLEARNPYRAIPRAVIGTAIGAGALYLIAGHVQTVAFSHGVALDAATTPFNAIADASAPWLSPVVGLGVAISSFACTVASIQGAARALYNLSREGALPTPLGHAHPTWHTPHVGIAVLGVISLAVPLAYVAFGSGDTAPRLWASFLATIVTGTYGYLLAYVLVSISTLVHFGRARRLHPGVAVAAVLATVSIAFVGWNVFTSYDHTLLYAFATALALGVAWYTFVWVTRREHASRVGTFTLAAEPASKPAPIHV
jgi:amino acid transporter